MAIEIIVEDGTNVPNANSYATLDEVKAYAEQRGYSLGSDDEKTKARMILAMDYIESFGSKYQGSPTYIDQALSWPRYDAGDWLSNGVPPNLLKAQAQLVIEQVINKVVLLPTTAAGAFITKEKIGPIETEYSEAVALSGGGNSPSIPAVDALLGSLFRVGSFRLKTYRA